MPTAVAIGNSDPRIHYNGSWSDHEQTASTSRRATHTVGDSATFSFNGSSVSVFGTVERISPGTSIYEIDSASLATYTAPNSTTRLSTHPFFLSPDLEDGLHVLVIRFTGGHQYGIEYLTYTPSPDTTSPSSSYERPSASVIAQLTQPNPHTITLLVALVGGALGWIFIMLLIAVMVIIFRRRRRKQADALPPGVIISLTPPPAQLRHNRNQSPLRIREAYI